MDAVQDGVQIAVVRLDLRIVQVLSRVLDRQRMEREGVAQQQRLWDRRGRQIDPDDGVPRRLKPEPLEAGGPLGPPVAVDENRDQP
jgi:hypothetical protein